MKKTQPAQNQHYVPKFILRNFLSNTKKEQIPVFSKSLKKGFVTSIRNIMAERRFHEFQIENDYFISFEESVCRLESTLLPTYRNVIQNRRLDGTSEEKSHLAMLVAFQLLRTRSQRDQFVTMERKLADHLEKFGGSLRDIEGYKPLTDNTLREQHIKFMRDTFSECAQIVSQKDFVLLEAPKGRRFYLSDNPVTLHNSQPQEGIFGNMGLACEGIEIYMPITSELQLCAWCPSLLENMRNKNTNLQRELATTILSPAMARAADPNLLMKQLSQLRARRVSIEKTIERVQEGVPLPASSENMDFHNWLQVGYAREHIICPQKDFTLAKKFLEQNSSLKNENFLII